MAASNHRQLPKSEESINRDIATTSYSPSASNSVRKKWRNVLPILMALVVIGEIAFLGRLDAVKNSDLVNSWADSFYRFTKTSSFSSWSIEDAAGSDSDQDLVSEPVGSCEAWLEKEDFVPHSRDFNKDPILVHGSTADWETCDVGCKFRFDSDMHFDATFGIPHQPAIAGVLRSMESSKYYPENSISVARGKGYDIVMTTSLSSDVPVGYFSWVEYDIMAPVEPKTEASPAAAFISNCGAKNFRLQALIGLEEAKVEIDSYGGCHRNRDGRVDKVETLKRYKFSLAFENSNEEDYVTEKYFQSLVAGSVPVFIGADNIQDFAPSHGSVLHIKKVEDVENIAKTIKYLAENSSAYNETLRWKYEGPSDSFKALFDMASVHSSCRLCIFLATKMQEKDEKRPEFEKRPCKCKNGSKTTYHIYVRERGKFEMKSVFLRSDDLTVEALSSAVLHKFKSIKYVPVWESERPKSIRSGSKELKVYRIYPVGMTQREALYTFSFKGDSDFRNYVQRHPCPKFEVIFV